MPSEIRDRIVERTTTLERITLKQPVQKWSVFNEQIDQEVNEEEIKVEEVEELGMMKEAVKS